jgi:Coenzyme PQQ synthesis protein D (PqqD)
VSSTCVKPSITPTSVVVAVKDQVSADLAGEAVILSLRTSMYYGLNPVGAQIWALLGTPVRVADICDKIAQEYDVEVDRCERDVLSVLGQLAGRGLIEIRDATNP